MVSDVTINTALNQQQKTDAAATGLAEDFAQFLTLLTVQLQNQDPLSPMDTTEFTNQLVAFTGVEQQINTNQKLDSLVAMNLGNSFSSALNYVGKTASYLSSEFYHDGSTPNSIKYALDDSAFEATIRVTDDAGNIIYEQDADTDAGSHDFVWDGTTTTGAQAAAGTYNIRIDALDFDGNAIGSSTVVSGLISGIETQNGAIFAIVGDRAVSVGNILNVGIASNTDTTDSGDDNTDTSGGSSNDNTDNNNDNSGGTNAQEQDKRNLGQWDFSDHYIQALAG